MLSKEQLIKLLTLSNTFKEGDEQLGGTKDESVRQQAQEALSHLTIGQISSTAIIDDQVTTAIQSLINEDLLNEISSMELNQVKEILLSPSCFEWVEKYRDALSSECIAAFAKLMTNEELSYVSKSLYNPIDDEFNKDEGDIKIGSMMHFGSRIQPNSPGDDSQEILFHAFEGLIHGCGDVIIGLNPSCDTTEEVITSENMLHSIVTRLKLPTRFCVLSDMVKQAQAKEAGNVDVGFQSLAGTSTALQGMLGVDVDGYVNLSKKFTGLYFETGQGSEVTNHRHEGIDMVTLESRCYGLARFIKHKTNCTWMIVNDVSGFIGPEVYKTGEQLLRACLEDLVMAKMHGITMGLDICSTFHMGINPTELEALTIKIVDMGSPAFIMAIAGKADPMLGYLTTAIKEHPRIRKYLNKKISSAMKKRLIELNILDENGDLLHNDQEAMEQLYVNYIKANANLTNTDDTKWIESLKAEARAQIKKMQLKGYAIGYGENRDLEDTQYEKDRLNQIYQNGVVALRTELNLFFFKECSMNYCLVQSSSVDRDDYIAHPASGEGLSHKSLLEIQSLFNNSTVSIPSVMFVISDGLNANAINAHAPLILPNIKKYLSEKKVSYYNRDIIVINGRVRLGYQIGEITQVEMIVHFIGERPGTGLDQMSVYITYGRNKFNQKMDHCMTTAICGIHPKGKSIAEATEEIKSIIIKGLDHKTTGVELSKKLSR